MIATVGVSVVDAQTEATNIRLMTGLDQLCLSYWAMHLTCAYER